MLEILRFLVKLGVCTNLEEFEICKHVLDHDVHKLGSLATITTVNEIVQVNWTVVYDLDGVTIAVESLVISLIGSVN